MRKRLEGLDFESDDEDESERRARLRREQKESDLKHAEDLFDGIGVPATRSNPKAITVADAEQPGNAIDLSAMPLFNPTTKDQFTQLRDILGPLLVANVKKAQYTIFMQEFAKDIVKELPSDQIKKIASGLTTLSNEKMREEKEAAKGGKKSKAQKTKTTLAGARNLETDTTAYDDGLDE
jgi:translation initiation factor 3 subunit J